MKHFSDRQLAGQRLMVGFDSDTLNNDLKYLIAELNVGGIILFSRNIPGSPQNPEQINELCRSAQEYAADCGLPPLFISTDQEGGKVARLRKPFTIFPGNPAMKSEEDARSFGKITASELKSVGINMNLAPVLDVAADESIMTDRAFSNNPEHVSLMGNAVIDSLQAGGVMAVAKHFPGIGRTVIDSHIDLPVSDLSLIDMKNTELVPFEAAIKQNVAGIMLSHIMYRRLDPDFPASLSEKIAGQLLRREMGFEGIVMTDDLDMGAIAEYYDITACIRQILSADIDVILICKKSRNIETAFEEILKNLRDSSELRSKGIKSFQRILAIKQKFM